MNEPKRFTFTDGPQAGRVVENDHPHMVLHANEDVRFPDPDKPGIYNVYRLHADGTATWVSR